MVSPKQKKKDLPIYILSSHSELVVYWKVNAMGTVCRYYMMILFVSR